MELLYRNFNTFLSLSKTANFGKDKSCGERTCLSARGLLMRLQLAIPSPSLCCTLQPGPLSLVQECRGLALIGRELHSVAMPALLCHKEPALLGALERIIPPLEIGGYFACSSLVLYGIRAPIIGPFCAWKPPILMQ